jgi:hypothetical protein
MMKSRNTGNLTGEHLWARTVINVRALTTRPIVNKLWRI